MPKAQSSAPAERIAQYDALVAAFPDVERKGAAMPYTAANGNMFSFLLPSGAMALRLDEADRAAFRGKYGGKPVVQHGAVLAEYVEVPPALLSKPTELRPYFAKSVAYARALKPKATKRKPAKAPARPSAARATKKAANAPTKKVPPNKERAGRTKRPKRRS
jgi:hypothetical protein